MNTPEGKIIVIVGVAAIVVVLMSTYVSYSVLATVISIGVTLAAIYWRH